MKVVVVGCTHAGTASVVNIKENTEYEVKEIAKVFMKKIIMYRFYHVV